MYWHQFQLSFIKQCVLGHHKPCVHLENKVKTHNHVKQYQNLTSSFKVIGNFLIQEYENNFKGQKSRSDVTEL